MSNKYNFQDLKIGEPRIFPYPELEPHKLIFYVKSAWQSFKKYNNCNWKIKFAESDQGVYVTRIF